MKHAVSRDLYAYWDRLRAGRAAPERGDLDPAAVRTLLGDILLLEFNTCERHVVRLAGTRICSLLGRELKGHPLSGLFAPEDCHELNLILHSVSADTVPAVAGVRGETDDGRHLNLELIALPLRHRGRTHTRMLGALSPFDIPYWAGMTPLSRLRLVSSRQLDRSLEADGTGIDLLTPPMRVVTGRLRLLKGGRA